MKCKFPGCHYKAEKTWALVNLCGMHHEAIRDETEKFYSGRISKSESEQRPLYGKIDALIPWSKVNLKAGDWK